MSQSLRDKTALEKHGAYPFIKGGRASEKQHVQGMLIRYLLWGTRVSGPHNQAQLRVCATRRTEGCRHTLQYTHESSPHK